APEVCRDPRQLQRVAARHSGWLRGGLSRLQRRNRVSLRDLTGAAAGEGIWRRGELEFPQQLHGLLSTGRQLLLAQRAQVSAATSERDRTSVSRQFASGS